MSDLDQTVIIAIIGSGALTALISNLFQIYRDKRNKIDGVNEALRLLLYDRIKYLSKKYIAKGNITVEELEDLQRMWDCYHDPNRLDGNGYLDKLMSAVHRLSIVNSSDD